MADDTVFTPRRHEIIGADAAPRMETLDARMHDLAALEDDIQLEVTSARVMAAGPFGIGWRATPQVADHLAWLLEQETDALTSYSLYCAVLATHPERLKESRLSMPLHAAFSLKAALVCPRPEIKVGWNGN